MNILWIFVKYFVLWIIQIIYPCVNIHSKYDMIIKNKNNIHKNENLTLSLWNDYVKYLIIVKHHGESNTRILKSNFFVQKNENKGDFFDNLIITKLAKMNHKIKMMITYSNDETISFDDFYFVFTELFGDENAKFKYRYTHNNIIFKSLISHDLPYKKFIIYDDID